MAVVAPQIGCDVLYRCRSFRGAGGVARNLPRCRHSGAGATGRKGSGGGGQGSRGAGRGAWVKGKEEGSHRKVLNQGGRAAKV